MKFDAEPSLSQAVTTEGYSRFLGW